MAQVYDFFISHSKSGKDAALELYNLLLSINPEWEIFLDCAPNQPLQVETEWHPAMLTHVSNSRYLIFVTGTADELKFRGSWVFDEIRHFHKKQITGIDPYNEDLNVAYWGIFLKDIDLKKDLYSDPVRGAEYESLYDFPQNLFLKENETIFSAAELIKTKVLNMTRSPINETAADLLDKTRQFAINKEMVDPMFSPKAIHDDLLPLLSSQEGKLCDFSKLLYALTENNVALLGSEGGSGKTSMLTKLFYYYLDTANLQSETETTMIPIYVDAKTLAADNYIILRYIAKNLYGERTAMTTRETSKTIGILNNEFSKNTISPTYLLLIDGYNEIPVESLMNFNKELADYLPGGVYRNVRIVISGRYIDYNHAEEGFAHFKLNELNIPTINKYLSSHNLPPVTSNSSISKILSVPMYLKMYADTDADNQIKNKGELLLKLVNWQTEKDKAGDDSNEMKSLYTVLLNHLLPYIAHRMVMSKETASSFIITEEEFEDLLVTATEYLNDNEYKRFYGKAYRDDFKYCKFADRKPLDLLDDALEYFDHGCKLLRKNGDDYEFIHQIYRDFFCAKFVAEDIKRSVSAENTCTSLENTRLESEVRDFTVDLLCESKPYFDVELNKWNYSCNDNSYLIHLPEIARNTGSCDNATFVSNIVDLLKYARMNDYSGCDFSGMNLTESNFVSSILFRQDEHGSYPARFTNARINRENIFHETHFSKLRTACIHDDILAVIDNDGILKLWKNREFAVTPVKTIAGVDFDVKKMIFAPDGKSIYAMTSYEIIEISIPEETYSEANPKILFETTKRLRNITLDPNGEIMFTTAFNVFNPKPISNPDAPDIRSFYGINSVADINSEGNQLAFGNVTGYQGLKIYNFCPETGEWAEQKVGYSLILDQLMQELEQTVKDFNLYTALPDDNEFISNSKETQRSFFYNLHTRFEICTHGHDEVPGLIINAVTRELGKSNVTPSAEFCEQLNALADKYVEIIHNKRAENPLLFTVSGRIISSVEYKKGSNTLLVSAINLHESKNLYDTMTIELDTQTLETRPVKNYQGGFRTFSMYSEDKIIVMNESSVSVYDKSGNNIMRLRTRQNTIEKFLHNRESDYFIAAATDFIYLFDLNGRCIGGMNNVLRETDLILCFDKNGRKHVIGRNEWNAAKSNKSKEIRVLDLTIGVYHKIPFKVNFGASSLKTVTEGTKAFKICENQLTTFENNFKTDAVDIYYRLFVYGCDFTGITGTLANTRDLRHLSRFGAITDSVPEKTYETTQSTEGFSPSETAFEPSTELSVTQSLYTYKSDSRIAIANIFKKLPGGENFYGLKLWRLIQRASRTKGGLEASDYSILEWVNRLNFATPKMIYDLMVANLVDKPTFYEFNRENVENHIVEALHRTYRLLGRYVFLDDEGVKGGDIFMNSKTFGAALLESTTDDEIFKFENHGIIDTTSTKRILALNQWFCLTLARHKDSLSRYAFQSEFDATVHFNGKGRIHRYIKLGNQAFFAQAFRHYDEKYPMGKIVDKIERMSLIATHYQKVVRNGLIREYITAPPVLVIIGESFSHCNTIATNVAHIAPHIRKLYTYDTLLTSDAAFNGSGNYFEFIDGESRAVNLKDLIN